MQNTDGKFKKIVFVVGVFLVALVTPMVTGGNIVYYVESDGASGGNIFDQDLNTTDSPTFDDITLSSFPNLDKDSTDDFSGDYPDLTNKPTNFSLDDLSDNDTDDLGEGASNFWCTLARIQSLCTNDFHNIGGVDDDVPDSGDLGLIDTEAEFEAELFAILTPGEGGGGNIFDQDLNTSDKVEFVGLNVSGNLVGIGITSPSADLHVKDQSGACTIIFEAEGGQTKVNLDTAGGANDPRLVFSIGGVDKFINFWDAGENQFIMYDEINDKNIVEFDSDTENLSIGQPGDIILGDDTERDMYPNTTGKINLGKAGNRFNDGWFSGKITVTGGVDPPYVLFDRIFFSDLIKKVDKEVPKNEPEKYDGMALFYDADIERMCAYNPLSGNVEQFVWKSDYDNLLDRVERLEKIVYGEI